MVLPYAYVDYGRFFARLDTLGVKTFALGYGYVEMIARVNFDGYDTDVAELQRLAKRSHSIPLGIGTFQKTLIGGFFIHAFHDVSYSRGHLFEAIYATKFTVNRVLIYPMLGAEYRNMSYTRYYYGVSEADSTVNGIPTYEPAGAFNPFVALQVEFPLTNTMNLNFYKFLKDRATHCTI